MPLAVMIASATFFVSLLDFAQPGELGVFIDEGQVQNLERRMNERGFTLAKDPKKSRGRIDACIALALAIDRAHDRQPPARGFVSAWA